MLNAALDIKKKIGLMHTVGSTYYNLAKAYLQNDELSKALENAKQALENDKKHNQDSIEDDISLINEIQAAK
jgi:Tfp pilus assembly protein PilF